MTTTATKTRIDGERIQWIVAGRARQWSGAIRFKRNAEGRRELEEVTLFPRSPR